MHQVYSFKYSGLLAALIIANSNAHADISGKVFRDFNSNGSFDSSASFNEVGMGGITVKAFDATGVQVGTASSAANGSYTLTGLGTGADYRVEFSWVEPWLKPSVAGGSSVQFVKDGATGVDLAINNPIDYSQADVYVSTPVAIVGPTDKTIATGVDYRNFAALVKFPVDAKGKPSDPGYISPTTLATHQQIGSTSGAAYHRETKKLFIGAYFKRATGFGAGGAGAIYSIDSSGLVNIHATIPNSGTDTHDFTGSYTSTAYDKASIPSVGKSSLGDLEISADGQKLYVVNLNDRHLYAVSTTSTNTATDLGAITRPNTCLDSDFRPFALGMDEANSLYVGAVCSNESGTDSSGRPSAMVLKYDGVGGFSEVFNTKLNFSTKFWGSWSNALDASDWPVSSQQPLLSDIVFNGKNMILAFRNRGWEIGYLPNGSQPGQGHVLMACWSGSAWVLESNGVCGGQMGALPNFASAEQTGPGSGYFYDMRDALSSVFGSNPVINGFGSLATVPGRTLIATLGDPRDLISGGVTHLNFANGSSSLAYQVFRGSGDGSNGGGSGGYFGKSSGLGDLELILDAAPLEIGNRVWRDTDADGLQDAGEAGIDGVDVVLTCGAQTATTKTANGGLYLFSSATNASFMQANDTCLISIEASQTALSGLTVTLQNQDGFTNNDAVTDIRDSDASAAGSISFIAGAAGENNHSLDFGYRELILSDLTLTKAVMPAQSKHGQQVVYTLTVTNESKTTATNVEVKDLLPAGLSYISDDGLSVYGNDVYDEAMGLWGVGIVPMGSSKVLNITVQVQ